jgi:hypothetical protein
MLQCMLLAEIQACPSLQHQSKKVSGAILLPSSPHVQPPHIVMGRGEVAGLLRQSVAANLVRVRGGWYRQSRGIAQVSVQFGSEKMQSSAHLSSMVVDYHSVLGSARVNAAPHRIAGDAYSDVSSRV